MIDYVKILFRDVNIKRLLGLPYLDFKTEVSESTGEFSTKRTAKYHFCKITIYDSGNVYFTGSIHKMYNSLKGIKAPNYKGVKHYKGFNGNQFNINNILEVRKHLTKLFDCTPQQMVFRSIELGINTIVPFTPYLYIKGLLYHRGISFEFRHGNNFGTVEHKFFIIKIYNKSNHYKMRGNILRVEYKSKKMAEVNSLGIKTFEDINVTTLNSSKELLLKRFNEVVYYDYTIDNKGLSTNQKRLIKDYSRQIFWIDETQSNRRGRHKSRLKKIIEEKSKNLHLKIRQEIIEKCVINNQLSESTKCVIKYPSSIGLNITQLHLRNCPITGVDISIQKEDSFLLSHTGLKHLYVTNRKKYDEVKRSHLTGKWIGSDFITEIREIAHNIRDTIRTRRDRQSRLYPRHQERLFNIEKLQL